MNDQYVLNKDVVGPYSGKLWGKKGERVTLISTHDVMVIVKGKADPFSAKIVDLDLYIAVEENEVDEAPAAAADSAISKTPMPGKRRKKSVPQKTSTNSQTNISKLF